MFLLDVTVFNRIGNSMVTYSGANLSAEIQRMISFEEEDFALMFFNAAAFIPLGFMLSMTLSLFKILAFGKCLGYTALIALGLSLLIECLQLVLHIGIFEFTDLFMNTSGAVFGALIFLATRAIVNNWRKRILL